MTDEVPGRRKSCLFSAIGLGVVMIVVVLLITAFIEPGFLTEEEDGIRMREDVDAVILPGDETDPADVE